MRTDVKIPSCGEELAGWLYLPEKRGKGKKKAPAIVMAHGLSAVKEMYLDVFAERFCAAGFVVTVFDYRFQGESPGEPRGQIFPHQQHDDYRNAITWTRQRAEVDPERIGIWGSSYSGAHVIHLAAFDRRVKCAVAQVPLVDGMENVRRLVRSDIIPGFLGMLSDEREKRMTDPGAVSYLPVVAEDMNAVLPTPDSWKWFIETGETRAPSWKNEMTFESVERLMQYNPASVIHHISPTPFCMIVAENDVLTPTDLALSAYQNAREPKRCVVLPGGHFDAYIDGIDKSSGAAIDWFTEHLMPT
jgi:fermentation-respiration switch protein FrsA (DUF1100 family)